MPCGQQYPSFIRKCYLKHTLEATDVKNSFRVRKAQAPSLSHSRLPHPPSPAISFLRPSREPWAPPQRPRVNSVLSARPLRWGWRSACLGRPASSLSLLRPQRPHQHCMEPRAPGQREPSLCFTASGQFFIVLIVSRFVLRNKKHFHTIFNLMIKPVSPLFLWLHEESGLLLPLPVSSQFPGIS